MMRLAEINVEERKIKMWGLLVLLVCFLTIYAPIELGRVIFRWGLTSEFIFELIFIWLFYSLAILIVSLIVQRSTRRKRVNKGRE